VISFEEAREKILAAALPLPAVRQPAMSALGFVLASEVRARADLPRFDNSAVDGFAVLAGSVPETGPVPLRRQTIRAGRAHALRVPPGSAVRVLTGAPMPRSADAVVMQEDAIVRGPSVEFLRMPVSGDNLRLAGEELRRGDVALPAGTPVNPAVAAFLVMLGLREVRVHRKPRVAVVVTGDELVPAGRRPGAGKIPDSNSPGLRTALAALGIKPVSVTHVHDRPAAVRRSLQAALARADVVVSSGGVSEGGTDHVRASCSRLGVRELFWKAAIKPGKPLFAGTKGRTVVVGLPGNPVSAMVCFHLFVRPLLLRMMGVTEQEREGRAVLGREFRKRAGRTEFVRGATTLSGSGELLVTPLRGQDSHMLGGLAGADVLIVAPPEAERLEAGSHVRVLPLRWGVL
jgi:molybdopterin molybdotransferase